MYEPERSDQADSAVAIAASLAMQARAAEARRELMYRGTATAARTARIRTTASSSTRLKPRRKLCRDIFRNILSGLRGAHPAGGDAPWPGGYAPDRFG